MSIVGPSSPDDSQWRQQRNSHTIASRRRLNTTLACPDVGIATKQPGANILERAPVCAVHTECSRLQENRGDGDAAWQQQRQPERASAKLRRSVSVCFQFQRFQPFADRRPDTTFPSFQSGQPTHPHHLPPAVRSFARSQIASPSARR